jgi:tRNA A-37 threonylcarbamoyl transferase component Bud32
LQCARKDQKGLVTTYFAGYSLLQYVTDDRRIPVTQQIDWHDKTAGTFVRLVTKMIHVLVQLEVSGVLHGDLHFGNWIYTHNGKNEFDVHLIDFGRSKVVDQSQHAYSRDVWTMGRLMRDLFKKFKVYQSLGHIPLELDTLLDQMTSLNAKSRPSFTQVLQNKLFLQL